MKAETALPPDPPPGERVQSPNVDAVCNNLAFEAIVEACDLAISYATSAREAAWRGNRRLTDAHLSELRLCVVAALAARKHFKPEGGA